MSAARNIMELVSRRMVIADEVENRVSNIQSTEDFFTRADRIELIKQGVQAEQILRELADIKLNAREQTGRNIEYVEAHEKRLRVLEDERLRLRTWAVILSGIVGTVVSVLIRILFK